MDTRGPPMVWRESMTETLYHEDKETQEAIEGMEIALSTQSSPVLYDPKTRKFFPTFPRRRDERFYRRGTAIRCVKQIKEEGAHKWSTVINEEWYNYKRWMNRNQVRYVAFPQIAVVIIVSREGNRLLPRDTHELINLLDEWIEGMPKKMNVRHSQGWGGKYAGIRPGTAKAEGEEREPPEEEKCLRLPRAWDISGIKDKLRHDGMRYHKDGSHLTVLELEPEPARKYVIKELGGYLPRKKKEN